MQNYENAINIMNERFGKDSLIAIATTDGDRLFNRIVDAYYENGAFYISTYALSNKVKQIETKSEVWTSPDYTDSKLSRRIILICYWYSIS